MRTRSAQVALVAAFAVVAAAPAAHAVTVVRDGNTIRIDAAAGEFNNMFVLNSGGMLRVVESNEGNGATISPGTGCAAAGTGTVDCGATATVTALVANLGDQVDQFQSIVTVPLTADGGAGADLISGTGANDSVTGGSGNDFFIDAGGDDTFDGGVGNDLSFDFLGNDTTFGGEGDDTLLDLDGSNTQDGGPGQDSLFGASGTDQLLGGPDNDFLLGGGRLEGADVIDGGPGRDTANVSSEGEPLNISLDGVANDGAPGQGANFLSIEDLAGGSAGDTLTGSAGPETLSGGGGADVIDGLAGGDSLFGGAQNDVLNGGDGNDGLWGGNGDDGLAGGAGADMVYGQLGADDMSGGDGRDTANFGNGTAYDGATVTLDDVANDGAEGEGDNARSDNENILGTGGPDLLIGRAGVNTITGGEGDDTIVTADGGPAAASRDHALCGAGEDTVQVDPLDFIGEKEELCEVVQYGDLAGWGPEVMVTAFGRGVGEAGLLPLELECPFRARGGCAGTVQLTVGSRKSGRVRFSLAAGEFGERSLRLGRRVRRSLARGRKVKGTLAITAADEIGATSTATKSVTLTR